MSERRLLPSTIDRVTVHRAGAVVRRRAALPAGASWPLAVALGPLPLGIDDASVRVSIVGGSDVSVRDVQTVVVVPPLGSPLQAPSEAEMRAARREVERLVTAIDTVERELAKLGSVRLSLATQHPKRTPKPAPLAAWRELDPWLRASRRERVGERVALERALLLAREAVQALDQEQQRARGARDASADVVSKEVRLWLSGDAATPALTLELEYIVAGATWVPSYVLRIARDGQSAGLAVRAHIAQASGEPWERVAMTLSTAEIRRELALPELTSLRIGRRQAAPLPSGWRAPPEGAAMLFEGLDRAARDKPPAQLPRPPELEAISVRPPPRKPARAPAAPPAGTIQPEPLEASVAFAADMMPMALAAPAPQTRAAPKRMAKAEAPAASGAIGMKDMPARAGGGERARTSEAAEEVEDLALGIDDEPAAPASRPAHDTLRYGELVMRGWDDPQRGRVLPEPHAHGAEVADAQARARAVLSLTPPTGTWALATSAGAFDYAYTAEAPVDVPSDSHYHNVALLARSAPIRSTLVIVPRESNQAVRIATLVNPLPAPLLAGPVDVYWGDELLVTAPIRTTPAGGELRVGLGVDEHVKVARNVHYEEETKGLLSASTYLRHDVTIDIGSRLGQAVRVEVRERVPLRDEVEKEDIDVQVTRVEPAWEDYDQSEVAPAPLRGGKRWRFELAPGADRRLGYSYVIKIGAKQELLGGNRRE